MSSPMSPVTERTESQSARLQSPVDAVIWPFEHFPPPPLDGNWLPRSAPPPPPKFPPPVPLRPSRRVFDPPIMELTYPPLPPLTEEDPTWLDQMLADVMRQRSFMETRFSELQADTADACVDASLANTELSQERARVQTFLNMVASVGGAGLVRRMLEDVANSVEAMSMPAEDYDGDDESAESSPRSSHRSPHSAHGDEPTI